MSSVPVGQAAARGPGIQEHLLSRLLGFAEPRPAIYHYTTQGGLLGILATKTIRCTDIRFLNDSRELRHAAELTSAILEKRTKRAEGAQALYNEFTRAAKILPDYPIYVTSFSEERDLLSQWRAYGHGSGFAIGFSAVEIMRQILPSGLPGVLLKCVYDTTEQEIEINYAIEYLIRVYGEQETKEHSREFTRHFFGFLVMAAACFKHPSFREEREWRLVLRTPVNRLLDTQLHFRLGTSTLVPYIEFALAPPEKGIPIQEIVVGPNPNLELSCSVVRQLLDRLKPKCEAKVDPSAIPYRNW
jgi:hypothetical protein